MFKKRFDQKGNSKKPWQILEKKMVFVGKMNWCVVREFDSALERNRKYDELISADGHRTQIVFGITQTKVLALISSTNRKYSKGHAWGYTLNSDKLVNEVLAMPLMINVSRLCNVLHYHRTDKMVGNANIALEALIKSINKNKVNYHA